MSKGSGPQSRPSQREGGSETGGRYRAETRRFAGYGSAAAEAARAEGRRRRAREAREAFEQGQDALAAGKPAEGFFWLERSERLTGGCSVATLAKVTAALALDRPQVALPGLQRLRQAHDLPEASYGEALCLERLGRVPEAARLLQHCLDHLPVPEAFQPLADRLARVSHRPGWATLSNDSTLLLRSPVAAEVRLDGELLGWLPPGRHMLEGLDKADEEAGPASGGHPGRYLAGRYLTVRVQGRDILGSPFDLQALRRCESLVVATESGISGWLYHPAEPDFRPKLFLEPLHPSFDVSEKNFPLDVSACLGPEGTQEAEEWFPAAQRGLIRPWFFTLERAALPDLAEGASFVLKDTHGRPLRGAPVYGSLADLRAHVPGVPVMSLPLAYKPAEPEEGRTDLSAPEPARQKPVDGCVVIVPVHNGSQDTFDCLQSLLLSVAPEEAQLLVIDDASTDPALLQRLEALAGSGRLTLLRNERNLGFVGSVNRGLAHVLAQAGVAENAVIPAAEAVLKPVPDVILLNSDTYVFPGWLSRLRRWLSLPRVGTATPFSNAGGQLSWPSVSQANPFPSLEEARQLDRLCASLPRAAPMNEESGTGVASPPPLVTGNGFCMGISGACLQQTGLLRAEVFAQGYGEENDFCLRASAAGFVHLAATDVYVRHRGNVSFGPGGQALLARNLRLVEMLHPGYLQQVQAFEQRDPLAPMRRELAEAWLLAQFEHFPAGKEIFTAGSVVLIEHEGGGGVARAVRERGAALRQEGFMALTLSPTASGCRLALAEPAAGEMPGQVRPEINYSLPAEGPRLVGLLKALGTKAVEWHHLVGHAPWMRQLHVELGVPYDAYVHDHVWFCPRIALLSPEGNYCGEPDLAACRACVARGGMVLGEEIELPALRQRSAQELAAARHVVAPSQDAGARLKRHFPASRPVTVRAPQDESRLRQAFREARVRRSHQPGHQSGRGSVSGENPVSRWRIGIVGGISRWKGGDLLLDLARYVHQAQLPLDFVLIGTSEHDEALISAGVAVTGPYREEEALELVEKAELDLGFIPSLAPETWCYALEWLWRAGVKVACFDIGAVPERIRAAERAAGGAEPGNEPFFGMVLPVLSAAGNDGVEKEVVALAQRLLALASQERPPGVAERSDKAQEAS
ncbi:glycosyltransferase [Oecophyllibacter saccharovorans]|nr:glycosyltransferase [Oecophyllibacter saccharovorans]